MHKGYKMIKDLVKLSPLSLPTVRDFTLLKVAESLIPYSIGIEIECTIKEELSIFLNRKEIMIGSYSIPFIIETNLDCAFEQRFRIPSGINGLICLWHICEFMKKYFALNPGSGIHYHVDFTDVYDDILYTDMFCRQNSNWLMKSLKSWNYSGRFNELRFSTSKDAVRLHSGHKTIEYRIGEMTFDYELMLKRIIHCCNMTRLLKEKVKKERKDKVMFIPIKNIKSYGRVERVIAPSYNSW